MSREELDSRLTELQKLGSRLQQSATTVARFNAINVSVVSRGSTHRGKRTPDTKAIAIHTTEPEMEPLTSRQGLVAILPTIFRDA